MAAPNTAKTQKTELNVTFTAPELSQLEAFAALHGETIVAFVERVALEATGAAPSRKSAKSHLF